MAANYTNIFVSGGGRIYLDEDEKVCSIFGKSYGFGMANHEQTLNVINEDNRYKDYTFKTSNEGY
jgi:hypothetical protein